MKQPSCPSCGETFLIDVEREQRSGTRWYCRRCAHRWTAKKDSSGVTS